MNDNRIKDLIKRADEIAKPFHVSEDRFRLQLGPGETRNLAFAGKPSTDAARGLVIVERGWRAEFSRDDGDPTVEFVSARESAQKLLGIDYGNVR